MNQNQKRTAQRQHVEDTMHRLDELASESFQHSASGDKINENIKEIDPKTQELFVLAAGAALRSL